MAKLTAAKRKALPKASFAVPKGKGSNPKVNSYPVHDKAHARNALAMVEQHGSPTEKKMVKAAVKRKHPTIAVSGTKATAKTSQGGSGARRAAFKAAPVKAAPRKRAAPARTSPTVRTGRRGR
jgi:hypothetical protein